MKFGFIGLGQMGAPMALNLAKQSSVIAYDRDVKIVNDLMGEGLNTTNNQNDLCDVDILILCLPTGQIVQSCLFDPQTGIASTLKKGSTVIDTSTIDHATMLQLANDLQALGIDFIDAPVSGMQTRAENGTLTMMCGGDVQVIEKHRQSLSAMASKILHMGPVGSGQTTKLVNQLLFDINAAAIAEILPLAVKLGLNPTQISDVINSSSGRSFASEFFIPHILNGDFNNGYPMSAAYKDLVNGAQISKTHNIPTPVLSAATKTYEQALDQGHGDKDKGAMILVFEKLLNVTFRKSDP